jgi:hypothetical protein
MVPAKSRGADGLSAYPRGMNWFSEPLAGAARRGNKSVRRYGSGHWETGVMGGLAAGTRKRGISLRVSEPRILSRSACMMARLPGRTGMARYRETPS